MDFFPQNQIFSQKFGLFPKKLYFYQKNPIFPKINQIFAEKSDFSQKNPICLIKNISQRHFNTLISWKKSFHFILGSIKIIDIF
jgi:hypothetical protein